MLRHYTRFIGKNIPTCQLNYSIEQTQLITQFSRRFSNGKNKVRFYEFFCAIKCSKFHAPFAHTKNVLTFILWFYYSIHFSDQKAKFSISDEAIIGRPLYLDAQATTSLVRIILWKIHTIVKIDWSSFYVISFRIQGYWMQCYHFWPVSMVIHIRVHTNTVGKQKRLSKRHVSRWPHWLVPTQKRLFSPRAQPNQIISLLKV